MPSSSRTFHLVSLFDLCLGDALYLQGLLRLSWSHAQPLSSDSKDEIKVPEHVERHGETVEVLRARLQYQSRKRGTLENGLLLR